MKSLLLTILSLIYCSCFIFAQKKDLSIHLHSGKRSLELNITSATIERLNKKFARLSNSLYVLIQFDVLPTEETKKLLAEEGVTLLDYIPNNTYTVSVRGKLNQSLLKKARARAILEPALQDKMYSTLAKEMLHKGPKVYREIWVSFPKTFSASEVLNQLRAMDYEIISDKLATNRIFSLNVEVNRLSELAGQPYIEYIQPAPPEDEPLNFTGRSLSRANVLNAAIANNGRGLNGEGVVVGVGDNANVLTHVDLTGRIIDHAQAANETHGMHVTGTVAGAGILNELNRGYASKATIISQTFSNIIYYTPTYVQQYGMVATNNSYGSSPSDCAYTGTYEMRARVIDQQALDFPNLQHVFAAGNSGDLSCAPAPSGFRTILGGYQSAKNVISVGNIDGSENIRNLSSKGPVKDGRLKPEIVALGTSVESTYPNNSYATLTGTSMAAPNVTGGLALLYQRYRQLHNNTNPKSGLIKALLCNGATDKGNNGPDFKYGFGEMNLLRSVEMLDQRHFLHDSTANLEEKLFTITVPANAAQLKIMLYWHDPAASDLSAKALVNDLDLQVITPGSQTLFPKVLDTSASRLNAVATNGPDHINNIEQAVIDNPQTGSYNIRVIGTEVAQNPTQEFFIVYDIIPNSVVMTYPTGGEGLVPGEKVNIRWDSYGDPSGNFSLSYSVDGGASWTSISTSINANSRFFEWTVPTNITDKALVRVTKSSGQSSTSNTFSIIGVPTVALSPIQCEEYFSIDWNAIDGATDYEVMMLKGDEMVSVAYTTSTTYTLSGLNKDSVYWLSVRARINGKGGRRALAISRTPNSGNCEGLVLDTDLALQAIISPASGRKFTSSELTGSTEVKVEIRNRDNEAINGFNVEYSIDGGHTWVKEAVVHTIDGMKPYAHTFSTPADLSAIGTYQVIAVVKGLDDNKAKNDTMYAEVKHLDNLPINLTSPFLDDLETALPETYIAKATGLKGLERYDLVSSTPNGRLRTYLNSGFAASGTKAINLDAYRKTTPYNVNSLIGTFNLSDYDVNSNELRLNFGVFSHIQYRSENNKVWVRQSDAFPWIEVYDLNMYDLDVNTINYNNRFSLVRNIEFGDSLLKHGQNVSSSFQIRLGQEGQNPTINEYGYNGYTFDDISIYRVLNDIQLVSIDTPTTVYCGANSLFPLKITLRNCTNNEINDIPVRYSINGGNWFTESIPTLTGNATYQYSFLNGLTLNEYGIYIIKVIADVSTDNYRLNDTIVITVKKLPLVTSFPYLENFEQGSAGWHAEGWNIAWQCGRPEDPQINGASSGRNAWKTSLNGTYNISESYLYSPCFHISEMQKPTLSFSLALNLDNSYDGMWIEYSVDGKEWYWLENTNTFNDFYVGQISKQWHVVTTPLPNTTSHMILRFGFYSDNDKIRESIAIDDIHIYDNVKNIYEGESLSAPITKTIDGANGWVDFESVGKLIASIHPNNQNLGSTEVNMFLNNNGVRHHSNQYYLDRSFTINPANTDLKDSVTIRLYFLDREVEELLNATGCNTCSTPTSGYELGVSDYEDNPSYENGTVDDNHNGVWSFHPRNKVVIVPFDKGYYAEFKVKDFSEFWLSHASLGNNIVLPVVLTDFNVQKEGKSHAVISWTVASEWNVDRYEIEMASENSSGQQRSFVKIGEVKSLGDIMQQRQYEFTDTDFPKSGVRNYRLKIVDQDGIFTYSETRSLKFGDTRGWLVYPNPSQDGKFFFVYQLETGAEATVQVTDAIGRLVMTYQARGSGYAERLLVDLSAGAFTSGVYMMKVVGGGKDQVFKIYKR